MTKPAQTVRMSEAKEKYDRSTVLAAALVECNSFLKWSLDPHCAITQQGTVMSFVSGQLNFRVEVEPAREGQENLFRYLRLVTFKNSLAQKTSPRPVWLVYDESERRNLLPSRVQIACPGLRDGSNEVGAEYWFVSWPPAE